MNGGPDFLSQLTSLGESCASREAYVNGDDRYSYGDLLSAASRLFALLEGQGVGAGDRIAHLGANSFHHTAFLYACAFLGVLYSPLDVWSSFTSNASILADLKPRLLLVGKTVRGNPVISSLGKEAKSQLSGIPVIDLLSPPWNESLLVKDAVEGFPTNTYADPDRPLVMLFTSGTTGRPKGVAFTQGAMMGQALIMDFGLHMGRDDRILNVFPANHHGGIMPRLEASVVGACCIDLPHPTTSETLRIIKSENVTFFVASPQTWQDLLRHPLAQKANFGSLRMANIGADRMTIGLIQEVMERTGATSIQGYGLTETGLLTLLPVEKARSHIGTAGIPLPFMRILVRNESGVPCRPNEVGAIWAHSPFGMCGVFQDGAIKKTSSELLSTQDFGYLDSDGFLTITGRSENLVKVRGARIDIEIIEQVLTQHESIDDAAILGVPDEQTGQALVAVIVAKSGCRVTKNEVIDWVSRNLAISAIPKVVLWLRGIFSGACR